MEVAVTGGAGFIGAHTVRALLASGARVTVLDDLSTGRRERLEPVPPGLELVVGDLRDRATLARVCAGKSHVLHLAALPSVARSVREPLASHDVNATGTAGLLEACRAAGVRRVVVASSSSVYGDAPGAGARHEGMAPRPVSPYAATKLATEAYALAWCRTYGLEAVALRYFNVFGPGQDPESAYAAVVPRFIAAGLRGQPVTVHGDGEQTRDFTFVANVVDANLRALAGPGGAGEALNVACGEAASVNRMVELVGAFLGRPLAVASGAPRPGDVRHSLADLARVRAALGYEPRVRFAEGLRRTVESFAAAARA